MKNKYSPFYAILGKFKKHHGMELVKEEVVKEFTKGRTDSLTAMNRIEYIVMINALNSRLQTAHLQPHPQPLNPTPDPSPKGEGSAQLDKKRKRLLSTFHELAAAKPDIWGRYIVNGKANAAEINGCINRIGCVKKEVFNDYTTAELSKLIAQFDNILTKEYGKSKA